MGGRNDEVNAARMVTRSARRCDNDTRGDLGRVPSDPKQQVEELLAARTAPIASWRDPTYGLIEIYRF